MTFKVVVSDGKEWPYMVNEKGEVYTTGNRYRGYKIEKLKGSVSHNGYLRVALSKKGKTRIVNLHRVVAETFIPNPYKLPSVNHKNGNKQDNRVENLEWCTHAQNTHHAVDNNFIKSNIDSKKVIEIKNLLRLGSMKQKDIAKKYLVCVSTISQINRGHIWK